MTLQFSFHHRNQSTFVKLCLLDGTKFRVRSVRASRAYRSMFFFSIAGCRELNMPLGLVPIASYRGLAACGNRSHGSLLRPSACGWLRTRSAEWALRSPAALPTSRSVCESHDRFLCILVFRFDFRQFRFESWGKIGKMTGNCSLLRHFLEHS